MFGKILVGKILNQSLNAAKILQKKICGIYINPDLTYLNLFCLHVLRAYLAAFTHQDFENTAEPYITMYTYIRMCNDIGRMNMT